MHNVLLNVEENRQYLNVFLLSILVHIIQIRFQRDSTENVVSVAKGRMGLHKLFTAHCFLL